jgi:hypothetical protein
MEIVETTADIYQSTFKKWPHIYNSVAFSELNRNKVEALHYLLLEDSKVRFGIVLGEKVEGLFSPFSAPFGGFTMEKPQYIDYINEAVLLLRDYGSKKSKSTKLSLPPLCYNLSQSTEFANALSHFGSVEYIDVNYYFDIAKFIDYEDIIERNARKNLHKSLSEDFEFSHFTNHDVEGVERAFEVIRCNRAEHGYPLRMSLDDVLHTIENIIQADFFVLTHEGVDVAAAQVFHVAEGVAQVIYWGDLKEYSQLRTMNLLSYRIFEYYYKAKEIKLLDIGPSTENGVPNVGLCDFKESIGCSTSPKFCFKI